MALDFFIGEHIISLTSVLGLVVACYLVFKQQTLLIPGPSTIPVFGNLFQLSQKEEWLQFTEWGKEYGDIYAVYIFAQPMIMLSSAKAITELFEHRSAIYSSRPHLVMAGELMGWGESVVLMPYNDRFRNYRKLLKLGLNSNAAREYWPLMEHEISKSLIQLLRKPEDFARIFRRNAGTVALKIAYGFTSEDEDFKNLLHDTEEALAMFAIAALPGIFLVDALPILKYVPSWFPGAGFQRLGENTQRLIRKVINGPFQRVKEAHIAGTANKSFTTLLLDAGGDASDNDLKWVAGGLYGGQADTTVAALSNFLLCLMLFPDVQKAAQKEIDVQVGRDRLPSIKDRQSLPYVEAVLLEVLRWQPVVPMVSHSVSKDDIYRGFHIPEGTALVANIWAALHDPIVYKDPEEFRPERFLPPECAPDSSAFAFGFGRRTCPGEAVAQATLFCNVAYILATLDIEYPLDSNGNKIEPVLQWSSGVTSHPHHFRCMIKPRNDQAEALIHRTAFERSDAR